MKKENWLLNLGLIVLIVLLAVDRFLVKLPTAVFVVAAVLGSGLILAGILRVSGKKK